MRILRIRKVARDARTGRFITARTAIRRPSTTVVETYKVPIRRVKRSAKR
jgi:hypothetical protein